MTAGTPAPASRVVVAGSECGCGTLVPPEKGGENTLSLSGHIRSCKHARCMLHHVTGLSLDTVLQSTC